MGSLLNASLVAWAMLAFAGNSLLYRVALKGGAIAAGPGTPGVWGLGGHASIARNWPSRVNRGPRSRFHPVVANLYPNKYISIMKAVRFLGNSLKCLRDFPEDAKQDAGYQIDKVQRGEQPDDFKPMPSVGKGVEEIRIWDESGTYRVVYTARIANAVIVLHAFQKKTQTTSKRDIDIAKERFNEFMKGQK